MTEAMTSPVDHVLLFKVKEGTTTEQLKTLQEGTSSLCQIPGVISTRVGEIFVESWMADRTAGYTHYIRVQLGSREDLRVYQDHKTHVKVREECIKPVLFGPPLVVDCDAPMFLA